LKQLNAVFITTRNSPTEFVKKLSAYLYEGGLLERAQTASRKLGVEKYSREKLSKEFGEVFRQG
jgi:hypothetical protein